MCQGMEIKPAGIVLIFCVKTTIVLKNFRIKRCGVKV
jgi:hypothetical protein